MKKVFITGATGFIGSHLAERCLAKGYSMRLLIRNGHQKEGYWKKKGVEIVYGDLRDDSIWKNSLKGCETVFHVAAKVSDWGAMDEFRTINIEGTRNICRNALEAGCTKLVAISTNDVFGIRNGVMIDESFPYLPWGEPYPDTKIEAANIVLEYGKKGLPITMIYPCYVYGPGDSTLIPILAHMIKNGEMLYWNKEMTIWPSYIDNVIDLMMLVADDQHATGQGYLVHDGHPITLREFCEKIAKTIHVNPPKLTIPYGAAFLAAILMQFFAKIVRAQTRPMLTTYIVRNFGTHWNFSIAKAKNELGWQPSVSFEEGFQRSMEWLKKTDASLWKQK